MIVADDHPLFLDGLVSTLDGAQDICVVGRAADADSAAQLAREHVPDIALLDLNLPGHGLSAAREIAASCPSTKIVVLTVSENEDDLMDALKAGASGYVLKGVSARELLSVLRSIAGGEVYVAPALAGRLMREMAKPRVAGPLDELSQRELEVLEQLATGMSNQEIARKLGLAEKTVKHYMTNILMKLQVRSRIEAALLAQKIGHVAHEDSSTTGPSNR